MRDVQEPAFSSDAERYLEFIIKITTVLPAISKIRQESSFQCAVGFSENQVLFNCPQLVVKFGVHTQNPSHEHIYVANGKCKDHHTGQCNENSVLPLHMIDGAHIAIANCRYLQLLHRLVFRV